MSANDFLITWNHRRELQAEIESCGILAHKIFQAEVFRASEVMDLGGQSVLECWSEIAKEYVCSGGAARPIARVFPEGYDGYRSVVLDSLAENRSKAGWPDHYPLHPAEFEIVRLINEDVDFGLSITGEASKVKLRGPAIATKGDLLRAFSAVAADFGFKASSLSASRVFERVAVELKIDSGLRCNIRNLECRLAIESAAVDGQLFL